MQTHAALCRSLFAVTLFCSALGAVAAAPGSGGAVHIPTRPPAALFEGQQGPQHTRIHFDPLTQTVTIELLVQDPKGYFIPNIRRQNFVVYENGVRQHNATVQIERAPVTLGVLLEHGGRYHALDEAVSEAVNTATSALLDEVGRNDQIAFWTYSDSVQELAGFNTPKDTLQGTLLSLGTPGASETNFYDALIDVLGRMQGLTGRKALLVVSSGLDTFSKATFQDALRAVESAGTPVYVLNLGPTLQRSLDGPPYTLLDWNRADRQLREIAQRSGGRVYAVDSGADLDGIFDDLMENLRVRYVITYRSTSDPASTQPRTVRIELVDPRTGGPLKIVDADGHTVRAKLSFESSYLRLGDDQIAPRA